MPNWKLLILAPPQEVSYDYLTDQVCCKNEKFFQA